MMITSTSNSQVKNILLLQNKSKARKKAGQFIVEGSKMVLEAPSERIVKIYVSESFLRNHQEVIKKLHIKFDSALFEEVSDSVFVHMSDTQTPQGIMAVVAMNNWNLDTMISSYDKPLIICIQNLQDPGNLGTIMRMAEGAGVSGIIASANTVDIYNPKTIRSTMGSIYRVPFAYADDFIGTMEMMKEKGIHVYAAHLEGIKSYTEPDYRLPTAFLVGNEANGLSQDVAHAASEYIKIPMQGEVESLNAAVACTVLTYEAVRQRDSNK